MVVIDLVVVGARSRFFCFVLSIDGVSGLIVSNSYIRVHDQNALTTRVFLPPIFPTTTTKETKNFKSITVSSIVGGGQLIVNSHSKSITLKARETAPQ